MPRIEYIPKKFSPARLELIDQAEAMCSDYARQGYDLTLRQLYYQFVARGIIPNKDTEYKRLGDIVNDARLAGLIDWRHITDRGRNLQAIQHWNDPADIVRDAGGWWATDRWSTQPTRVECWVEKQALEGVIGGVCNRNDVPYFACKGYTSQSEMWGAAQRIGRHLARGQNVVILHLGDHDPSGIDMTRDIRDRLAMFVKRDEARVGIAILRRHVAASTLDPAADDYLTEGTRILDEEHTTWATLTVDRIALNMDQIRQYDPPPNPAKVTDSRYHDYRYHFGDECWELDALEPSVLVALIEDGITDNRDADLWDEATDEQEHHRSILRRASKHWDGVARFIDGIDTPPTKETA